MPDDTIKTRIEGIRTVRGDSEEELKQAVPIYAEQVRQMEFLYGEHQGNRELKQQERLLIALGMALISGSPSAVEWTTTRCKNHGVRQGQINEVIELALLNGGTFVVANARFAHQVSKTWNVAARSKVRVAASVST